MRIVFMGTPDFSVNVLVSLVEAGHEVAAVVTQPDKPKGRGKTVLMTPVKEKALEYQIPVYQPVKVRDPEFIKLIKDLMPDAVVVVAFGQIISKELLEVPRLGCVNIHASLLPKYRGSAPIQWAVINGEKETGITTMMMDTGIDTGDMLEKVIIPIEKEETGGSLNDKLSHAGAQLILSTLEGLEKKTIVPIPQPEEGTCYVSRLTKTMGDIDWTSSAEAIERLVRGLNPWPSAYTMWNGKTLKIWSAQVAEWTGEGRPGQVVACDSDSLVVKTGDQALSIKELQLEGKKRMDIASFLRGYTVECGTVFERRE